VLIGRGRRGLHWPWPYLSISPAHGALAVAVVHAVAFLISIRAAADLGAYGAVEAKKVCAEGQLLHAAQTEDLRAGGVKAAPEVFAHVAAAMAGPSGGGLEGR